MKKNKDESGHRSGSRKKISKKHTTSIKEAGALVDAALRLPKVKISLGEIRPIPGGRPRLKFAPVHGGHKVTVRGRTAIQYVMVYSPQPEQTKAALEALFNEKFG